MQKKATCPRLLKCCKEAKKKKKPKGGGPSNPREVGKGKKGV